MHPQPQEQEVFIRDKIAMKQCIKDENYDLIHDFSIGAEEKSVNILVSGYVCCKCNNKIWIGMVLEIDMENKELLILSLCTQLFHHIHFTGKKILRKYVLYH